MTIWSGPFSSTSLADGVTEVRWRRMMRMLGDGIMGGYGSTALQVTAAGDGLSVNLAIGFAMVQGSMIHNDASANFTNPANGGGSGRPDRMVLRYQAGSVDTISPIIVTGTVGGAAPPAMTQDTADAGIWELPVARWVRAAGGGIGSLVDERQFMDRSGGLVIADAAVTTAVTLGTLIPTPWVGQEIMTMPSGRRYTWTGASWERVDLAPLLDIVNTGLIAPTNTSFATAAGTAPSGSFVAPQSGRVKITISAYLRPPAGFSVHFGAHTTSAGGFDHMPLEGGPEALRFAGAEGTVQATITGQYFLSSLTPGTSYTITGVHAVSGSSGHQQIDNRRIIVERA